MNSQKNKLLHISTLILMTSRVEDTHVFCLLRIAGWRYLVSTVLRSGNSFCFWAKTIEDARKREKIRRMVTGGSSKVSSSLPPLSGRASSLRSRLLEDDGEGRASWQQPPPCPPQLSSRPRPRNTGLRVSPVIIRTNVDQIFMQLEQHHWLASDDEDNSVDITCAFYNISIS